MVEIAPFGVEAWLNQYEKSAQYDISQSTIASMTMAEILNLDGHGGQEFYAQLNEQPMNYGWIEGSPDFKAEVAKLYQHVNPDQVLQTNGATGANFLALYGLIKSGDHVIAEYPSYQQLYDIPKSLGAKVDYWHIKAEQNWYPDLVELKQLIRPDTKLICLNNANNPTGTVLDRQFLTKVVAIAKQVGAYILVDEVYQPLDERVDYVSIVDLYARGIATNSLSKTYSVPGVRIGWVVANDEISEKLRKYRDYTMICGGVFNDLLATYVLRHKEQVLARNRQLVWHNLKIYQAWVAKEPRVSLITPQAVSTSFPHLDIPVDTINFCRQLLKEQGVLLVPGEAFDLPGYVRLGYCAKPEILTAGLRRLSIALHQFD